MVVGSPSHEIVKVAAAEQVDLIVIATHGRTGFSHLVMGSVAERVVRTAPCPVMTIRPMAVTAEHGTCLWSEGLIAWLDSRACKGDTWRMEDGNAQFLLGLQEGDGCIPHDYLWRCSEHGLFLHHRLQPREQKKVGGARTERGWKACGTIAAHVQEARRADQLRLYAARDALMSMDGASHPILPGLDTHCLTPADWRNRPVPYKLTT